METNKKTRSRFKKLVKTLQGKSRFLIVMQDNPDPDSIAAAIALRKLANSLAGLKCSIVHGGTIGRGENRVLVRYLNLQFLRFQQVKFGQFDLIGMVDTQPGIGNNSLQGNIVPDIVFDHHPFKHTTRLSDFHDVRRDYGATSTILLEYMNEAGIIPDTHLATALLYAIRSDTQDLGREATRADVEAIGLLYPIANKRMLSEIQHGSVTKEYFKMLGEALKNARIYQNSIVTHMVKINNPDMIGEIADLFLREDETTWTMCTGCFQGKLLISIRTSQEANRADKVIRRIVAGKGFGGGHLTYAGGQIPLTKATESKTERMKKLIQRRFLKAVHISGEHWSRLVPE